MMKVGRPLQPDERSSTGMYAIMSTKTNKILRVCLSHEITQIIVDFKWRYVAECYVDPIA
jgi:hypothetical protein